MKRLLLIIGLMLVLAPVAQAAKPGPSLDLVSAGVNQAATISGCGYPANAQVSIYGYKNPRRETFINFVVVPTDGSGCFSYSGFVPPESGNYNISAFYDPNGTNQFAQFTTGNLHV